MQPELSTRVSAPPGASARSAEPAAANGMSRQLRGLDYAAGEQMLAPKPPAPARPMGMAEIQTRLAGLGYDPGPIDGKIGTKTRAAIKAFQEAMGLDMDGIVGPDTAAALRGAPGAGQAQVAPAEVAQVAPAEVAPAEAAQVAPAEAAQVAPAEAAQVAPAEAAVAPVEAPKANEPAWKLNPATQLKVKDIIKLSYEDLIYYMDTRPAPHVESLGRERKFVDHAVALGGERAAQVAVRIILRTPDSVVEFGAARAEAIRILTSQLRDPAIIRRLLQAEVRVVIVPSNKLMTDLPEFAAQRGTYTFDGRPWDTVRGLGSKNTAITEENLLGSDVASGNSRAGWRDQASMEAALAAGRTKPNEAGNAGPTDADAVMNNPGVYCEGYSTTNHEFFHTIHMYGLSQADNQLVQREYDKKRTMPNATHWADGPRLMPDGVTPSENYSSVTIYEYFAQTGCAYQGTNTGTDPYTGNPRNNGQSWVNTHEPEMAKLYGRICSNTELKNVNPRAARAAQEAAKTAAPAPLAPIGSGASPAPAPAPAPSEAMGFIQEK